MLPSGPDDLDKSRREDGSTYIFNEEDKTWKDLGITKLYNIVGYDNDGLVNTELHELLKSIPQLNSFRLTKDKPYFYLFYNGDKLIDINPEQSNCLRIEVSKANIFRKLTRLPCVGIRGPRGVQGPAGRTGRTAKPECFMFTQHGSFEVCVPTPLPNNPISLRGFDENREQVFETLINLDGSFEENEFIESIKLQNDILIGKLTDNSLVIKARQVGPNGTQGANGQNAVIIEDQFIENNEKHIESVSSFFFNEPVNKLIYRVEEVIGEHCVFHLSPITSDPIGNSWAGVELATRDCKWVEYHEVAPDPLKPPLDIPHWCPTAACYDQQRYAIGYLAWKNQVSLPFDLFLEPTPKTGSCKEPFWFCQNDSKECSIVDINIQPKIELEDFSSSSSSSSSTDGGSSSQSTSESECCDESQNDVEVSGSGCAEVNGTYTWKSSSGCEFIWGNGDFDLVVTVDAGGGADAEIQDFTDGTATGCGFGQVIHAGTFSAMCEENGEITFSTTLTNDPCGSSCGGSVNINKAS